MTTDFSRSHALFVEAQKVIPGGVNSPVRAFKGVGGEPIFFKQANGAYLIDEDTQRYIDYVCSWGAIILGHAHPTVTEALQTAINNGLSFGAPTGIEVAMAQKISTLMPNIESIRMVNSGTEATFSAIRLARGFTQRDKIVKFEGCYHGHADALLVKAGSGTLTLGIPSSAGVPRACAQDTLTATFNDLDSVTQLFEQYGNTIAAIIVEPVAGNMNCVLPQSGFLAGLRQICDQYGSLLIFDEVMTGFRVALGGAQSLYSVKPDLTTLGKVIGGGLPVGALGGRKDIMNYLAPLGPVYQAGTLSGNPIAMTAGLTVLNLISQQADFYQKLHQRAQQLTQGLVERAETAGIPMRATVVGGMFGLFFDDIIRFKQFFHAMLAEGIYLAPSAFEAGFITAQHTETEIAKTLAIAEKVFNQGL